ncbi:MAG: pyridoxamine 5'-phosphate oxidase family protein [Deltaproteobacteria bacterium]|nr:pyridoxamine 5'-phosphate oxidase family protein [Deltaproteobacteria bacterium]
MPNLPEAASQAWGQKEKLVIFTTADPAGNPNSIYVVFTKKFTEDKIVIADNYFSKTRANIRSGSRGAVLYITPEKKAFQIKGRIEYVTDGEIFDDMKRWNNPAYPGVGAAVLHVEEVYCGAERLL